MAPKAQKLLPRDVESKKRSTVVNGRRWYYIDSPSTISQKGTIFLVHGFPDLSFAWRNQIPFLNSLGFRTIAIDCMGYSDTGTSSNLADFSYKSHADAIAGIAKAIGARTIVIGGHDWGGAVVFRVAQWYPDLVTHIFSVCTAYGPTSLEYTPTERVVKTLPVFGYQLQFGSEDQKVERVVKDEKALRKFLSGMYGGRASDGGRFMTPEHGIDLKRLEGQEIGLSPLFDQEEFDYYVKEFIKNGVNGPLNWYRLRRVNWEQEKDLPNEVRNHVKQPTLHIFATKDDVLTRATNKGMEKFVPNLTRAEVTAGHWALWQAPDAVNEHLKNWLEGVVLGGKPKL